MTNGYIYRIRRNSYLTIRLNEDYLASRCLLFLLCNWLAALRRVRSARSDIADYAVVTTNSVMQSQPFHIQPCTTIDMSIGYYYRIRRKIKLTNRLNISVSWGYENSFFYGCLWPGLDIPSTATALTLPWAFKTIGMTTCYHYCNRHNIYLTIRLNVKDLVS